MRPFFLLLLLTPLLAWAEAESSSVEDNIRAMDTDHDGQVSVTEMRAYLEAQHGKGYRSDVLDEMDKRAEAKSCGSPFSRSLY